MSKKCPICKLNINNSNHTNTRHHLSYIKIMEWKEEIAVKQNNLLLDKIAYAKQIGNLIKLYERQGNKEEKEKMEKMIHDIFTK